MRVAHVQSPERDLKRLARQDQRQQREDMLEAPVRAIPDHVVHDG
jgi:hypothetical protein